MNRIITRESQLSFSLGGFTPLSIEHISKRGKVPVTAEPCPPIPELKDFEIIFSLERVKQSIAATCRSPQLSDWA